MRNWWGGEPQAGPSTPLTKKPGAWDELEPSMGCDPDLGKTGCATKHHHAGSGPWEPSPFPGHARCWL